MKVFKFNYSDIEGLTRLDPEYYNPKYVSKVNLVRNLNSKRLLEIFDISLGPAYPSSAISNKGDIPIAKIGDVTNKRYTNNWDLISSSEFIKYGSKAIEQNEILITLTGDPPDVGKVNMPYTEFDLFEQRLAFNQRVGKLSSKELSPFFLFAVLSSEYFRIRFEQCALGIRQRNVSIPDLRNAFVFLPDDDTIERIAGKVKEHFRLNALSQGLYIQATQLLEDALGLNNIEFKKEKSYTATFSEIVSNNRADADFYQTKYRQLAGHLETINTVRLGSICNITKGFEVGSAAYKEEGPLFIRVSNLSKNGFIQGNSDKYISESLYNSLKAYQPNIGDILLTKDGTIGTCYVVDEMVEGIISGGILNLALLSPEIPKEYLALVINSKACNMQANRDCSGALILHWKPEEIRKLKIPILSTELMEELNELAIESKIARKESKKLLEQAKQEVEQLIEQAAKN